MKGKKASKSAAVDDIYLCFLSAIHYQQMFLQQIANTSSVGEQQASAKKSLWKSKRALQPFLYSKALKNPLKFYYNIIVNLYISKKRMKMQFKFHYGLKDNETFFFAFLMFAVARLFICRFQLSKNEKLHRVPCSIICTKYEADGSTSKKRSARKKASETEKMHQQQIYNVKRICVKQYFP